MTAGALLVALVNGAWQGALLCLLAQLAFRFARSLNAATMFVVWSVLLAICVGLPFANAFASRVYTVQAAVAAPDSASAAPLRSPGTRSSAVTAVAAAPVQPTLRERAAGTGILVMQNAWLVLAALGLFAALRLLLLAREIAGMVRARRETTRIAPPISAKVPIARPHAFASSETLTSPCVLGFTPALIVIPRPLLSAPERDLLSVVLHEAEHVRRYDDVQNIVHRILGALAFFCPGVRIALRELALYRERICDDAAVNGLGDALAYAKTLTGMAQWAQGRGVPVPSLVFKRKHLLRRLDVLLDRAMNHSLRLNRRFAFLTALSLIVAAVFVLRVQVPVIAAAAAPATPAIVKHAAPRKIVAAKVTPVKVTAVPAKIAPVAPRQSKPITVQTTVRTAVRTRTHIHTHTHAHAQTRTRYAYAYAQSSAQIAPVTPVARHNSDSLLEALEAAGLRGLNVDQLIALRDHGVGGPLISAAHAFFQGALTPEALVRLADRGVGPGYLQSLRSAGLHDLTPDDVIRMRDHGVDAAFIVRVRSYNPRAGIDDIIKLRDSGF